jgi:hypothetical protein
VAENKMPGFAFQASRDYKPSVCRKAACRTTAGRRFAVRKFESGYKTRTTSPRLNGIVDIHFRPVAILAEWLEPLTHIGHLLLIDAAFRLVH